MQGAVIVEKDYEAMSKAAAGRIKAVIVQNPKAVIVLATGHSPRRAYQILAEEIKRDCIDVSQVTFVKLDEWLGLPEDNEATCEFFLQRELLKPLGISKEQYLHFHSLPEEPAMECERFIKEYEALRKINLVILGIGKNGHLGLNEPGEKLTARAHCTMLDAKTRMHEMLTQSGQKAEQGITMGMAELFRGEEILLLADGKEKEEMLSWYLNSEISTQVPVSFLKLHPNCICMVNGEDFPDLMKK